MVPRSPRVRVQAFRDAHLGAEKRAQERAATATRTRMVLCIVAGCKGTAWRRQRVSGDRLSVCTHACVSECMHACMHAICIVRYAYIRTNCYFNTASNNVCTLCVAQLYSCLQHFAMRTSNVSNHNSIASRNSEVFLASAMFS